MKDQQESRWKNILMGFIVLQIITTAAAAFKINLLHERTVQLAGALEVAAARVKELDLRVLSNREYLTKHVNEHLSEILPEFVAAASTKFEQHTLSNIRVKSLSVVNAQGEERIQLGMGASPFTGNANTFIKVLSPNGTSPILIHSTDFGANVSVDARVMLGAIKGGSASLDVFRQPYATGSVSAVTVGATPKVTGLFIRDERDKIRVNVNALQDEAGIVIFDPDAKPAAAAISDTNSTRMGVTDSAGAMRSAIGIVPSGASAFFMKNTAGEVVFETASSSEPYATSFLKQDPAAQAWAVAGTFSTLKTFWDLIRR